jgi:beta-lactam-binding protein with PASTA domain
MSSTPALEKPLDPPSQRSPGENGGTRNPRSLLLLQCASSCAGTVLGSLAGSGTTGKLITSIGGTCIGAFLTAPGKHHPRRIVAVALLLFLLDAGKSLAARIRHPFSTPPAGRRDGARIASALPRTTPQSLVAMGAAAAVGFGVGWAIVQSHLVVSAKPVKQTSASHSQPRAAVSGSRSSAVVPRVDGLTERVALAALRRAGFATTASWQSSRTVAEGSVISTSPAGGTRARRGSAVGVLVSSGSSAPSLVAVPQVAGLSENEAVMRLAGAGFAPAPASAQSGSVPSGLVISTSPAGGSEAQKGSTVAVLVSTGASRAKVSVPNVVGMISTNAAGELDASGLSWSPQDEPSATVALGHVISTSPAGGAEVQPGSTVTIFISTGPARVTVPNVVGEPESAAAATLRNSGFEPTTQPGGNSSTVPKGDVISTNPPAGWKWPQSSTVTLVLSEGPSSTLVPPVSGTDVGTADGELTAAGLKPQTTYESSSSVPKGQVISTQPGGGAEVPQGSTVTVFVSQGP